MSLEWVLLYMSGLDQDLRCLDRDWLKVCMLGMAKNYISLAPGWVGANVWNDSECMYLELPGTCVWTSLLHEILASGHQYLDWVCNVGPGMALRSIVQT